VAELVDDFTDGFAPNCDPSVRVKQPLQAFRGGVHGGMRVSAQCAGNLWVTVRGQLSREVRDHAAGDDGSSMAPAPKQVLAVHPHTVTDGFDNRGKPNRGGTGVGLTVVSEEPLHGARTDLSADAIKFNQRAESGDRTFDFSNRASTSTRDRIFGSGCQIESAL
jgi:hypothetical protein